jgi:hypothetical protein
MSAEDPNPLIQVAARFTARIATTVSAKLIAARSRHMRGAGFKGFNGDGLWPLLTEFNETIALALDSKSTLYVLHDIEKLGAQDPVDRLPVPSVPYRAETRAKPRGFMGSRRAGMPGSPSANLERRQRHHAFSR